MLRNRMMPAIGLLMPQIAWASDFSGLIPLYVGLVVIIGGILAGLEWVLINAVMDRGEQADDNDPESQNKSRYGCGLAAVLWAVNSLGTHVVFLIVWL